MYLFLIFFKKNSYLEEWKKNRSIIADILKTRLKNANRQKKLNSNTKK